MTHQPTVLVVEDEPNLADLYATWLDAEYAVRTAYSGEAAIEGLGDDVDVVLLDRRMPGLSGDDVLEFIRDRGHDCRVAMVTAVEPDFDIIDMGFDDYLVKPIDCDALIDTVERLIQRSTYSSKLDEYASLISKKIALESEKTEAEIDASDEFVELENRIERIRNDVDPMAKTFDDEDVAAVLRDLPSGAQS